MDPLDSAEILVQGSRRVLDRPAVGGSQTAAAKAPSPRAASAATLGSAPRLTILQAEQLLQIVATTQPTPISRQIAAAAYLMESEAQQELARTRRVSSESGREWFA